MRALPVFSLVLLVVWVRVSWAALLPGDSNLDGYVSASDVPALVNILAGATSNSNADANGDGVISMADLDAAASLIFATPRLYCDSLSAPLPIRDDDPAGVADTITIPDTATIQDLKVRVDITHAFVGDLIILLTHVDTGITVILLDRPGIPASSDGCDGADIMCTFDDEAERAAESACATPPPAIGGSVQPFRPLSGVAGQSIGGTWRLQVFDESIISTGRLNGWCLQVNAAPSQTPTPNPTPSPTPTSPGPGRLSCDTLPGPLLIPDGDPNGITNTITIADSTTIADLNVQLDITHSFVGDLIVTLTHVETGTMVTLLDRPGIPDTSDGCDSEDVECTFDDQADRIAENECAASSPAIGGAVQPNGRLADFIGQSIGGTWRLQVSDNNDFDLGTLDRWCLQLNSE